MCKFLYLISDNNPGMRIKFYIVRRLRLVTLTRVGPFKPM